MVVLERSTRDAAPWSLETPYVAAVVGGGGGTESTEIFDSENNNEPPRAAAEANRRDINAAKFDAWVDLGRHVPSSPGISNRDEAIERNSCMLEDLLATALSYDAYIMNLAGSENSIDVINGADVRPRRHDRPSSSHSHQDGNRFSIPAIHIRETNDILLSPTLRMQIRKFVTYISSQYHHVGFHSFEHASHVMLSATKIVYMLQMKSPFHKLMNGDNEDLNQDRKNLPEAPIPMNNHEVETKIQNLEGTIYDPWIHFTIALSALLHDVDHKGLPNAQLSAESDPIAKRYGSVECMKSYAEWNSLDIGLTLLNDEEGYGELDRVLGKNKQRLYRMITDLILCTDIASKERRDLGMKQWKNACCMEENTAKYRRRATIEMNNTSSHLHNNRNSFKLFTPEAAKAISEQIMQAADVSHTMQHFSTFTKWNKRLYHEVLAAHKCGRTLAHHERRKGHSASEIHHPKENWFESQIGFFNVYIIPLAERLDACGAFSDDDKFAPLAVQNKENWIKLGRDLTKLMVMEAECMELRPPMPVVLVDDSRKKTEVKFDTDITDYKSDENFETSSRTSPSVTSSHNSSLGGLKKSSRSISSYSSSFTESMLKWSNRNIVGVDSSVNAIVPYIFVTQLLDSFQNDVQKVSPSMRVKALQTAISKYQSDGSIQRHCGALLVVDISGFTRLSQKYPIEDFKIFINAYFTKIIDLVHSFEGDVVKFAGDALFAIWTTKKVSVDIDGSDSNVSETNRYECSHAINIEKCTACAIAINAECNNYKVSKSYSRRSSLECNNGKEVRYSFNDKNAEYEERVSVLNVHCGVSEGTMAGVDVVANNRAQFLLVGKPLKDVANAEALAAAGELVVSPSVYYSLTKTRRYSSFSSKLIFTNVGCELGLGWESGFHRVSWSDLSITADVILNHFKDRNCISNRKRECAQSLINNLVKNTYSMSEEDVISLQDNLMRLLENHRHEAARDVVGRFTAELRRVVVLFINILIEPSLPENPSDDKFLLDNLQSIYSIIAESVSSRSGQIRQFIYDDKGTVLIASFGLRGSVLLNAADIALDAAREAQSKLLDIMDVQCSIGISLGNIFCGETGSPERYEHSLLGPEVNLAARLMAKSKPGQINCDEEFKNHTGPKHTFAISGTHKLKGYSKPVPFFMPVQYKSDVEYEEQDDIASFLMQKVVGLDLVLDIVKNRGLICNMMRHRVIIIKGDEVTGKEAFIHGILKELSVNSCSVILDANRCFHDEPFYSFIPIITKAILSFAAPRERLLLLKKSQMRSSVLSSFLANDAFKANAFPTWADMVPDHLMPYLGLVNEFIYRGFPIFKSSSEAALLKDSEKVEKCAEVLCALIIRYLELRQSHGILSIPEMEALDIYSKKLLRQILSSEANLLLIGGVDNSFPSCDEEDTMDNILACILGKELDLKVDLINLDLLDVNSTFDLFTWSLRRNFTREELDIIHQSEVLDKIFAICGGMPHATTGLANTFCSQFKKQFHDDEGERTVNLLEFTHTFLDDTPTDFQEIICYRLDQMKPEEQMLLKVCSVAGFGQYSFSQNLLENIVLGISRGDGEDKLIMEKYSDNDNESENNDFNESGMGLLSVMACDVPYSAIASEDSGYLNYMLQGDNFKEILESLVAHNYLKEINVEMSDLGSMDSVMYRFRNDHEQSVINGLMLNDQKRRMHFEVALHYSLTIQRGGGESFGDNESSSLSTDMTHIVPADWELLNVIAMHFDLADVPIPAMLHYYESSSALSSLGIRDRVHNRLLSAYMMLEKVLQHASTKYVKIEESKDQRREVASQMIRTIRGDQLKDNSAVLAKLTKEHLRLAFRGDIDAFKQSLTVLIKFAQSVGTIEKEGYLFGSELYSQAIQMLLLVLDDDVFANLTTYLSSFLGQVDIKKCTKIKTRDEDSPDDDSSLGESCFDEDFHIDDLTVSFPAFSGLLTFFYYSPMGANQVQETFLANLFAALAQEAKQTLHVLRTKCILSHLYLKHGNEEKGLEESEEIKVIYDHDQYSLDLVKTYGMDWAILNVATMASTYLFKGQFAAAYENIEFLKTQMAKLDEFASSTKATTKGIISSFYLLLLDFENAADSSSGLKATTYNYFYMPVGILQEELSNRELALSQHTPFDSSACDFDLLSVLSPDWSSDGVHQGQNLQTAYINYPPPSIRSMMHQGAETLSDRGVEALRAALCATEIRNFELQPNKNADTTRKQLNYCQAGLIHLNQSLGQHDATNHERRKNYLMCLYQQAELLFWHQALISKLMSFAESADDILGISGTEMDIAKKSLDKCKELSENMYPFMQLMIGKRYIELGLDTEGGEDLIHHALTSVDDADSSILSQLGFVSARC